MFCTLPFFQCLCILCFAQLFAKNSLLFLMFIAVAGTDQNCIKSRM